MSGAATMVQVNVVPSLPTGSNHPLSMGELKIYPNPSSEVFYLSGNLDWVQELSLYDVRGKKILSLVPDGKSGSLMISAAGLDRGIYFLHATGKKQALGW